MDRWLRNRFVELFLTWMVFFIILLFITILFSTCKSTHNVISTDTIFVATERVDTTYLSHADSVYRHDSTFIFRNDTLQVEKYYYYEYKGKADTVFKYVMKNDTVVNTRIKEVEKKLTLWQKAKQDFGGYAFLAVVIFIILLIFYVIRRLGSP